jgi:2-polyprenyl-6-methoxyphenol hydroxylase-like FAD-dependent oxidoreductase
MGDAAVGIQPVTAHGYNLGLAGAKTLSAEIENARLLGLDIGSAAVLEAYARKHKKASAFLYHGTNLMVGIYTDRRPTSLFLRAAGLRLANHLPPFKKYVTQQLTGKAA